MRTPIAKNELSLSGPLHRIISMRVRLAMVLFSLVAVTVLALVSFKYFSAREIMTRRIEDHLQLATKDRVRMIQNYVDRQHERIQLVASRTRLRELLHKYEGDRSELFRTQSKRILVDAKKTAFDFVHVSVTDSKGVIVTSTDDAMIGRDLSDNPDYQRGITQAHLGELEQAEDAVEAWLTAPAVWEGRHLGVVVVRLDAAQLVEILEYGKGFEVRIGRADGNNVRFLLPRSSDQPLRLADVPPIVSALNGDEEFTETTFAGTKVLAAFQPVDFQKDYQDWALVAWMDKDQAYADVRKLRDFALLVSALCLLVALAVGWTIASTYAKPIMRLAKSATEIAQGNYEARVPENSNDEVGMLSRSFNEMAGQIQASHRTLEGRVEERTNELARANDELKRSNRDLQQFAAIASHDLQEPLRAVSGYTQLLLRMYGDQLDDQAHELMQQSVDGARRMQSLIDNLLEFSRVQTDGQNFETVSCEAAVQTAIQNLERSIIETGTVVTYDDLGTVIADPNQLTQLFQNLISNAIKFRREAPRILIRAEHRDSETVFSVRDNGIGVSQRDAERIFSIFQRLHSREDYPGAGLGLAICKRIVDRHGGRIWVQSHLGEGSTFYFTLDQSLIEAQVR